MSYVIDTYTPTRVVFGAGRLKELATVALPGKKALVCVTADGLMERLGIQQKVLGYLRENGCDAVVFDKVTPNPTLRGVAEATALAKAEGCDFFLGLGGGSSIDTAKAAAIMMVNPGDLWDYAYTGTGGRKQVRGAYPIVTVSTTCGTGTETDPYCVITNEETQEKLDFAVDEAFPALSVIDPELMLSLPRVLTIYQGFDALFHASETYITNGNKNRLVSLYSAEAIRTIAEALPAVVRDPSDLDARVRLSYAANILCGYVQALTPCTSHHIIAQTAGGRFPNLPHGASLIVMAEAYYDRIRAFCPALCDEIGRLMGSAPDAAAPGFAMVDGLRRLMDATEIRGLAMSGFGIGRADLAAIADQAVNGTGLDCDPYTLTLADVQEILEKSYR